MALLTRAAGQGLRCLAALALAAVLACAAAAEPVKDYQVEAVYLFNFTQFVQWPQEPGSAEDTPLVIGVLGEDPFGAYLDETVRGERVGKRPLAIARYARVEDVDACQVLFVSRSETARLEQILARLRGRSILTVGDTEGFVHRGGMVGFVLQGGRVRLRIDADAARAADLSISSKLLRVAELESSPEPRR